MLRIISALFETKAIERPSSTVAVDVDAVTKGPAMKLLATWEMFEARDVLGQNNGMIMGMS